MIVAGVQVNYFIEYQGQSVELPVGETVVGRDITCRLRFNDSAVSRRHLRFVRREDDLFVEDLKSSNGTLLNTRLISGPMRLKDGDQIQVGGATLVLRAVDDEETMSDTFTRSVELPPEPAVKAPVPWMRANTMPMAIPQIPITAMSRQRCPKCGSAVSEQDDACGNCGFEWGGFRTTTNTDVRGNSRSGIAMRRHERYAVALQIVYVSQELEIEATTLDLSPSGVFVCSQVLDPVGTRCQLTLLVDGGPPLQIGGIVRRVVTHDDSDMRETGLGVEFTNVGAIERAWLDAVIARQLDAAG